MGQRGPKPDIPAGLTADSIRTGKPTPPDHLWPEAKAEWKRVVDVLYNNRLLITLDRGILAEYCQTWALCVKCEKFLEGKPSLSFETEKGFIAQWPEAGILSKARKQLESYCKLLGFAPSVRCRLLLPKEDEKQDSYAKEEEKRRAKIEKAKQDRDKKISK